MDKLPSPLASTTAFTQREHKLFINNQWLSAETEQSFTTHNPANEEALASIAEASPNDVNKAIAAAREAFDNPQSEWQRLRPRDRQNLLLKLADLMDRDAQILAELECLNNGKSAAIAQAVDIRVGIDVVRYMAGWATKISGKSVDVSLPYMPADTQFHGFTRREPVGVVAAIVTWNFPFLLACWKLAPALAAGCTMVMKPADETPLTALKIAELIEEAGFPPGVFNLITGGAAATGAALSSHPQGIKITFTGCTTVGKIIGKAAMDNMARLTLDVGGKSATIVLPDADVTQAIAGTAEAIFFNHGQVCSAGSRLYVHESIYDKVVAGVASAANSMTLGNAIDATADLGHLTRAKQQRMMPG